jgi:hypothetical protein
MLEILIPLILLLTGFSLSKIQFVFESKPRALTPDLYGSGIERIILNKQVVEPPSDAELINRNVDLTGRDLGEEDIFDLSSDLIQYD